MTTNEPGAGGWAWLTQLPRNEAIFTRLLKTWDGLFIGACPCGRDVDWDAFNFQPICTCPVRFPELFPQSPPGPEEVLA